MSPRHRRSFVAVLAAVLSLTRPARSEDAAGEWFDRSFSARRRLEFDSAARAGEAACFRVSTARLVHPDARDLRLVVEGRGSVPLEVLEVGPGDTALVRFELLDPSLAHHLYLGSESAGVGKRPREAPRGGLLLEIFELPDGSVDSLTDAERLLKAKPRRLGVLLPRTIALGLPPLGRQDRWFARYTGSLRVETEGIHRFELASEGASFLLVDGKLAASWPGDHGLEGHGDPAERKKHSGSRRLSAGPHAVECLVLARRGGSHVVGWAPPGETNPRPIRAQEFVRFREPRLGPLELERGPVAEFDWSIVSDSGADRERHEFAELEFRFAGHLEGRMPGLVRWEFGDGLAGEGETVRHVYLAHGRYEVRCLVSLASGQALEARRTVLVRFEGMERGDLDGLLTGYFEATRSVALERLGASPLANLVWLRGLSDEWKAERTAALERWFALEPTPEGVIPEPLGSWGMERAIERVRSEDSEEVTLRILERLERAGGTPESRLLALVWRKGLESRGAEPAKALAAETELRTLHERGGTGDPGRWAGLFLGRSLLRRAEWASAAAVLARIDADEGLRRFRGPRATASGSHSLRFDAHLRERKVPEAREELEAWEWDLPADLLSGAIGIARARLDLATGRADRASTDLEALLRLPGAADFRPRILLLLAEALRAKGDEPGRRKRLEELRRTCPGTPEGKEAEVLLAK